MIILLHGADQLAVRRRLDALREEADGGTGMLATNLTELSGRTVRPGEILAAAMAAPFLAPKRMVIVSGLLDRFGAIDAATGRSSGQAPAIKPFEPLLEGLAAGLPETTILVFTGESLARANPLRSRLAKMADVADEEHKEPSRRELPGRVANEAKLRGIAIEPPAARLLAEAIGSDTLALSAELDKLGSYTAGRAVTADDVREVSSANRTARSFEFSDALLDGDLRKAWEAQQILAAAGVSVDELLGYLLEILRTIARVIEMREQRESPDAIGKAIRQPYPNLRDRAIRRADRLGRPGLRRAYETVVAIDRERKQGKINDAVAIELLVGRFTGATAVR